MKEYRQTMKFNEYVALECQEMLRHKWIESEKAGRDMGQEALLDWVDRHASGFRRYVTDVLHEAIEVDTALFVAPSRQA